MSVRTELEHLVADLPADAQAELLADVLAILILLDPPGPKDALEQALVRSFAQRARLEGLSLEDAPQWIALYFEESASSAFALALAQLLRSDLAFGRDGLDHAALASVGISVKRSLPPARRPTGTVPAGPAARFAVQEMLPRR